MWNFNKLCKKIAVAVATIMFSFCWMLPVRALTTELQFESSDGYRVTTAFSYDSEHSPRILSATGQESDRAIESLTVNFFSPEGEVLARYDNIANSKVRGDYFEFHYDRATEKPLSRIDLGGESAGEIYLKGDIEKGLHLIEVEPSGEERIIDRDGWKISQSDRS